MKLSDYILLSREERTAHIDLSTPCDVRSHRCKERKEVILELLGVEDDVSNWFVGGVRNCHLCECDSTNGYCLNPLHFYVGTQKDNTRDIPLERLRRGGALGGATNRKNGTGIFAMSAEEWSAAGRKGGLKGGRNGGLAAGALVHKQLWISTIDGFIGWPGGVAYHNKLAGGDGSERVRLDEKDGHLLKQFGLSRFKRSNRNRPPHHTEEVK